MTVAPVIPITELALIGSDLGPFQTSFPFEVAADVWVWLNVPDPTGVVTPQRLALTYDYTLAAPNPLANGGQVTLNSGLLPSGGWPAASTLQMERHTATGQPTSLGDQIGFQPSTYEAALDHVARQVQDYEAMAADVDSDPGGGGQGGTALFPTVAAAAATAGLGAAYSAIRTLGHNSPTDGGAATYIHATATTAGGFQGVDGQWWQLAGPDCNVCQFGADNTGATSSVAAFNAAIGWANGRAIGTPAAGFQTQSIGLPRGTYKIDANLNPITAPGVTLQGAGYEAVLQISAPGAAFTWSNNAFGGGMRNATLQYSANPGAAAVLFQLSGAVEQVFRDLYIFNANTIAVLGTDASHIASAITFDNILGYVFNSGQPTFDARWGSALFLRGVGLYVDKVAVPSFDRLSTMTTVANTNFLNFTHGGWDTVVMDGGCNINRYWCGVYVNAPGAVIQNLMLRNNFFDYCSSDAISLTAATNAAGGVFNVDVAGSYITSWSGSGIAVAGNNANEIHDFSFVNIYMAGKHGIDLQGPATRNIKMHGCRIGNVNRLNGGTCSGINIGAIVGYVEVIGGTCLDDPSGAFPWSAYYGITIAPNINYFRVQGGAFKGTNKNYNIVADTTQSADRIVGNNASADYAGFQTGGLWTLPASSGNWINKSPWRVTVTVYGMDLGIGVNSTDLSPLTQGAWTLSPGDAMFLAYSSAVNTRIHFRVEP